MQFTHKTEALCITRYMNERDMIDWLKWHINICHFDHIHIIDNESPFDLKTLCNKFNDKVSYEFISGIPRQYLIYDDYINNKSSAEWIIPIDDDEYLDLTTFTSINDALEYYNNRFPNLMLLAIRWKHLFPQAFHTERHTSVLEYCTREHATLASAFQPIGDCGVKTFVHRIGKVHYEETEETPKSGHIPLHELADGAYGFDGSILHGLGFDKIPQNTTNEFLRILHCRYKGYSEYVNKYILHKNVRISNKAHTVKRFLFNQLLPTLN